MTAARTGRPGKFLVTATLLGIVAVFLLVKPIPQWPEYHRTADGRTMLGVTKVCEALDAEIYLASGWLSGHALKHVVSAAASAAVLLMLIRRRG